MAAIALIGTPRAWQELGNLLEVAQQKAQMKFWSMVMRPAGSAEVELVAAEDAVPARHVKPCPDERNQEHFELVSYREPRRAKTVARRQRTEARAQGLIAHARRTVPADTVIVERAILEGLKDANFDFSEVSKSVPAPQPARGVKAAAHPRPAAPDTLTFVQPPTMAPVAAAMSDKDVTHQFKLMKKALSENRILQRPRNRLPAPKVNTFVPAS